MKFYSINIKGTNRSLSSLISQACIKKKIKYIELDPTTYDFSKKIYLSKNDFLYTINPKGKSKILERFLLNDKVITFYKSYNRALCSYPHSSFIHEKIGISIPKTIFGITKDRKLLKKYITELNGFPIILKSINGSHGIGVVKVDSFSSLVSIVDYLVSISVDKNFILREFISPSGNKCYSYRSVVLGGKVEISYINQSVEKDDFRSNINQKERKRKIINLPKSQENQIVKAVEVLGLDLGAVDYIIDKAQNIKIFEVNFPFDFSPIVQDLKYPICDKMIDFLIEKSLLR